MSNFTVSKYPLVTIDMKMKIARLSIALAFLTLSTEDFKELVVKEEHVKYIAEFIQKKYTAAGVDSLAKMEKSETLSIEEMESLKKNLVEILGNENRMRNIVDYMLSCVKFTKADLVGKFQLKDRNELRPMLSFLQEEMMLDSSKGFSPTKRLIEFSKYKENAMVAPLATV